MKKYEITFIVGETYTEDKAKDIAKNVRELIEKEGGKIDVDLFWGKKKLVYKIAKNTFGYYFVLVFFIDSKKIAELNKELKMNEKVIRYLIVDFVEKTPFFEEIAERKNKSVNGKSGGDDVIEENLKKSAKKRKEKPIDSELVVEKIDSSSTEISEEKKNEIEDSETILDTEIQEEQKEEEIKEKVENIEEIGNLEEKIEEETEEDIADKENFEEENKKEKEEIKEEKEEKTKNKKDEGFAERKSDKNKMSDEDRKAQLEKKLAELLKEEEEQ